MSKLIALVDGSHYVASVCDHAAWIAGRTGAAVELLHVLGRRETASAPADFSGALPLGARSQLLAELSAHDEQRAKLARARGRAILDDAAARLAAAGVAAVETRLRLGDFVEAVGEAEAEADMVVIGKRGEAADFATLHLGSNLERIARATARPLFVAARAFRPVTRVLIAYDGGASGRKAVDHIAASPLFAGLHCRLLTVGPATAEAGRQLDEARARLEAAGRTVEAGIAGGEPEAAIADTVGAEGIDLLVMGAYGHTRIRSLIIGSTTSEMLRLCRIPVMLFR